MLYAMNKMYKSPTKNHRRFISSLLKAKAIEKLKSLVIKFLEPKSLLLWTILFFVPLLSVYILAEKEIPQIVLVALLANYAFVVPHLTIPGMLNRPFTLVLWWVFSIYWTIFCFAIIHTFYGILAADGTLFSDMKTGLYFSTVTFTNLGYGDFRPSPDGQFFAAFEAILGYIMLGIFLVNLIRVLPVNPEKDKVNNQSVKREVGPSDQDD